MWRICRPWMIVVKGEHSIADTVYGILKYLYTVDVRRADIDNENEKKNNDYLNACLQRRGMSSFRLAVYGVTNRSHKPLPMSIFKMENKEHTQYGKGQKQSSRTCWWRWSWPCWQALCPLWAPEGIAEDDPEESVFAFLLHCGVHSWVPTGMGSSEDNDGLGKV